MKIALIGNGAIACYVLDHQSQETYQVAALLLRPNRLPEHPEIGVATVSDLPSEIRLVVDCAGHKALRNFGPDILHSSRALITVSIGALADDALLQELTQAATFGGTTLHLTSGAIGTLDALRAAKSGALRSVTYIGRKPPMGWEGSPAENILDLKTMTDTPKTHFKGTARQAALEYPKNANVAAAVAFAGLGFDKTTVELIADPTITANIHEIQATGEFGNLSFQIQGDTLPGNPRTSALAAMSVVSKLQDLSAPIRF